MRILIDMNLSPQWVVVLGRQGFSATHWSTVGRDDAPDYEIMAWALKNDCMVLTHDLDFGALLALTHAGGPSVLQIRAQNVSPESIEPVVVASIKKFADALRCGALLVVDQSQTRVRLLPLC
jgi:predicted nuclease of predicted toxin-antitoxin system